MSKTITIRKGLDIKLIGEAEKVKSGVEFANNFVIKTTDFHGLTPKLVVKIGDKVKAGSVLFFDKNVDKSIDKDIETILKDGVFGLQEITTDRQKIYAGSNTDCAFDRFPYGTGSIQGADCRNHACIGWRICKRVIGSGNVAK